MTLWTENFEKCVMTKYTVIQPVHLYVVTSTKKNICSVILKNSWEGCSVLPDHANLAEVQASQGEASAGLTSQKLLTRHNDDILPECCVGLQIGSRALGGGSIDQVVQMEFP